MKYCVLQMTINIGCYCDNVQKSTFLPDDDETDMNHSVALQLHSINRVTV